MVIVSTILYVDMLRFANTFSAQLNDFIILVINWIFCIFVFIINLAIAIYGFVCGCCYSKEFEKIIQNEQPKSAFSFTTSNKVYFYLKVTKLLNRISYFQTYPIFKTPAHTVMSFHSCPILDIEVNKFMLKDNLLS